MFEPSADPSARSAALVSIAERLIACQAELDDLALTHEAAYIDMALNQLRRHTPIESISFEELAKKLGLSD